MQSLKNLSGFSLIELLVVITIIAIVSMGIYLPYSHHQKKTLIKQGGNEITSSIQQARNMAIHGVSSGTGNLHIGLLFEQDVLTYRGYELSNTGSVSEVLQTKKLPRGIWLDDDYRGNEFFFEAITGDLTKRQSDGSVMMLEYEEVINFSYMGAETDSLKGSIIYQTRSHISKF